MRNITLLMGLLHLFFAQPTLHAQLPCAPDRAAELLASAQAILLGEDFRQAPTVALSSLPYLETCPDAVAQKAEIHLQVASWEISFEHIKEAAEHLQIAGSLLKEDVRQTQKIKLWQARLGLLSRDLELTKRALEEVLETPLELDTSVCAQAWLLRARMFHLLTKPVEGSASLDSAMVYISATQSLALRAEAWSMRAELYFIAGEFAKAVAIADTALAATAQSTDLSVAEYRYRLMETSGRLARTVIGINEGHQRLLKAQQMAENMPPYLRERFLPSALSQLVFSTFEQHGEEAAEGVFKKLETSINPERIIHKAHYAEALTQRARTYNSLGQYDQAIGFCEQSNAILQALPGDFSQRIAGNYTFIAAGYRLMGDHESSIEAGETALAIRKKLQPGFIGLGAIYNEILAACTRRKDSTRVKTRLLEFEALIENQKDQANFEYLTYSIAYHWINYWRLVGQPLKGIPQAETFLKTSGSKARMRGIITTELEFRICDAYQEGGKYREAFERMEPIVLRLKKRFQESAGIFAQHYSWVLAQSAFIALDVFEQMGDTAMLRIAESRCTEAEDLLFSLREQDPRTGKRNFVTDEFLYNCLIRIRAALFKRNGLQFHVERAFAVSESYQLVDMQRLLSEKQAMNFGGVGPVLAKAERDLQKKMADLESEKSSLRFQPPGPETDQLAVNIETQLSLARLRYDSLLNDLGKQFPEYYQLKFQLPVITLASAQQKMLASGQCMLKIIPFNDTAICLIIRTDTSLLLMTGFGEQRLKDLDIVLDGLRKYPEQAELPEAVFAKNQQAFVDASARVYSSLLAPLAPWLDKDIILAPNGIFNEIPFEALLTSPTTQVARPGSWAFWGEGKNISYTSSATIFQFVQNRPSFRKDIKKALVMAPYFSGKIKEEANDGYTARQRSDFFKPLPHTGQEALSTAQLLDGEAFVGKQCSVNDFLAKAENYAVLHLATHASAGGKGRPAFISFQPLGDDWRSAMLFESDIYPLRISAQLVTLSACETGLGKIRSGDGLHGLTRAFTCAGARNVVASLWSVNDASTQQLMVLFYQEIKKGVPYSQALANAKRAFVKENRSYAHPYYWAGFVLNGR
jgi:CHAT domain-containing protein